MKLWALAATVAAFLTAAPMTQAAEPVRIGVGSFNLNNLPFPLAVGLGYYAEEGLDVTMENFAAGGSKALQALVSGSVDVGVGFYDHTIQMQSVRKEVVSVALLAHNSGLVLAGPENTRFDPARPETIKGLNVGITAPGSSSDFFIRYYLKRHGLNPSDIGIIGVGSGPTAVVALEQGKIDLLVNYDPAATILTERKIGKILIDGRSAAGATEIYGGLYPTSTLYVTGATLKAKPEMIQKAVNATVRAMLWAQSHSAEEIMAKLPPSFVPEDKEGYAQAIRNAMPILSPDGLFDPATLQVPLDVLSAFNPQVAGAAIDLNKTYTNAFVEKALAQYRK